MAPVTLNWSESHCSCAATRCPPTRRGDLARGAQQPPASGRSFLRLQRTRRTRVQCASEGQLTAARAYCEEAIAAAEETESTWLLPQYWRLLGDVVFFEGDPTTWRKLYRKALAACRHHDRRLVAPVTLHLGTLCYQHRRLLAGGSSQHGSTRCHRCLPRGCGPGEGLHAGPIRTNAKTTGGGSSRLSARKNTSDSYAIGKMLSLEQSCDLALGKTNPSSGRPADIPGWAHGYLASDLGRAQGPRPISRRLTWASGPCPPCAASDCPRRRRPHDRDSQDRPEQRSSPKLLASGFSLSRLQAKDITVERGDSPAEHPGPFRGGDGVSSGLPADRRTPCSERRSSTPKTSATLSGSSTTTQQRR